MRSATLDLGAFPIRLPHLSPRRRPAASGLRQQTWVLVATLLAPPAYGTVLHVPVEYPSLRSAVEAAVDGDEIRVAPGVYTGPLNRSIDFAGKDIDLISESGPETTIIDLDGVDQAFNLHSNEPSTSSIDGFTIRNGSSMFVLRSGGAIRCYGAATRIRNCIIEDCVGCGAGGGISYQTSSPTSITDCVIRDCRAAPEGGGTGHGGGLALNGPITVRRCTIESNRAIPDPLDVAAQGGGVYCRGGAYLEDCLIVGNQAVMGGSYGSCLGGGVYGTAEFALVRCTIAGNRATTNGGGVLAIGPGRIEDCLVTGNLAEGSGGGVAVTGGGVFTILSTTIAGNRSLGTALPPQPGGGLLVLAGGDVTVRQSILRANCDATGQGNEGFVAAGAALSFFCSALYPPGLVTEGVVSVSEDCVLTDPLFCGPVSCEQAPSPDGDYTLSAGSPCLPQNNACGQRMGAGAEGCGPTATHPTSWGAIKARFHP